MAHKGLRSSSRNFPISSADEARGSTVSVPNSLSFSCAIRIGSSQRDHGPHRGGRDDENRREQRTGRAVVLCEV
jgi:hypothetical protein